MAQAPKTPPPTPQPGRVANPQPDASVYGGRWGGGDNSPGETGQPDRPEPIRPPSKQK